MSHNDLVTIAILAKDKAHVLPYYLSLIEKQTYPASKIKLYIRTNNNTDSTAKILTKWVHQVKDRYSEVYLDTSDVPESVQNFAPHEWNPMRFKVLGKIRQDSIDWAIKKGTHYFVVDCDNFITSFTLEKLLETHLPVVAPMLRNGDDPAHLYSNFHYDTDSNGYYKDSPHYYTIIFRQMIGLFQVNVVHCTYLIRNEYLPAVSYDDQSYRYEYVIFSDTLRKAHIPQYIDNRYDYGKLTFCDTEESFKAKKIIVG